MTVCFVDTETLGLDADHQPMWEVALITPDDAEHVWQIEVTQREIALAHPKALEIGRFDGRYAKERVPHPAQTVAALFASFTQGHHLAGAVVSFDEERLRRLCWAHNIPHEWHYHLVDVEAMAAGYLSALTRIAGEPTPARNRHGELVDVSPQPPWDSTALSRAVGVDPDDYDRHTALGDARWAKAIYQAVTGGTR